MNKLLRRRALARIAAALAIVWTSHFFSTGALSRIARCAELPAAVDQPQGKEAKAPFRQEGWRVIYIGNTRAGYVHSFTESKVRGGQTIIVSEVEMILAITRFGQTNKTRTFVRAEETPAGDLIKYQFDLQNPPAAVARSSGQVEGDVLHLETEIAGKVTQRDIAWDRSAKAPGYHERQLREHPLKPGEKRSIKVFDPELSTANTITLQAVDFEPVDLLDGARKKLLKVTSTHSGAPGIVMEDFIDGTGESWKSTMSLLKMAHYKVTKEVALESLTGAEADLGVGTMIRVVPIKNSLTSRRAVYRIRIPGEDPSRLIATSASQQVRKAGSDSVELTVTAIVPPPNGAGQIPNEIAGTYLQPTGFIQSDNEGVKMHASRAVGAETDPWKACVLMERYVYENLKKKNFMTLLASAAEVARTMSGDCTEHAVLLAAMLRAREIPSRVAVGLVYVGSLSSFGYHMWTEAYVRGTWVPLDATLGRGGIAADHIKILDSNLSDSGPAPIKDFLPMISVLGKTEIEVLKVE